jgi:hypothetical protein
LLLFLDPGSEIRDPGRVKITKHPGSASLHTGYSRYQDNSHENVPLKDSHLEKDEDMALLLDIFEPLLDKSHENVPLKDSHLEKDEDMALLLDNLEPLLQPLLQGSHHIPVIPGRCHFFIPG